MKNDDRVYAVLVFISLMLVLILLSIFVTGGISREILGELR